jgi:type II secretory ATPase GspE/PulE/Tfp pilus assembly ATPase PilB-like protein
MNPSIPPEKMEELIGTASKKLGAQPEQLKKALEGGNAQQLVDQLSPAQKQQLNALLSDREAAERFLSTPQAKMLLQKLMRGKGK